MEKKTVKAYENEAAKGEEKRFFLNMKVDSMLRLYRKVKDAELLVYVKMILSILFRYEDPDDLEDLKKESKKKYNELIEDEKL